MGVLEARENAEVVGFPVVGEEVKDASNVINYNINGEQTKDTFATINANNQTTTGMATVIPGVNAPKLIEATSIISTPDIGYISATATGTWDEGHPTGRQDTIVNYTLSDEIGKYKFTLEGAHHSRIVIPADGTYQLDIIYPQHGTVVYWVTRIYDTTPSGIFIDHTGTTGSATTQETETIIRSFKKHAQIYAIVEFHYVGSGSSGDRNPTLTMTFTRLG